MLKRVGSLDYDSSLTSLFIHSSESHSDDVIRKWLKSHSSDYAKVTVYYSEDQIQEPMARKMALQAALGNISQTMAIKKKSKN